MRKRKPPKTMRQMLDDYCASYPEAYPPAIPMQLQGTKGQVGAVRKQCDATKLFAMSPPWNLKAPAEEAPNAKTSEAKTSKAKKSKPREKAFRFLDLPAEIQTLIYEEFAYDTYIHCWPVAASADARALLGTCRQIRRDFTPSLFEYARLRLTVEHWDFSELDHFWRHIDNHPLAKRAASGNKRVHSTIKARIWHHENDEHKLRLWLTTSATMPRYDFTYEVCRTRDFGAFITGPQFLWVVGMGEIRDIWLRLDLVQRQHLSRIMEAFQEQADQSGEGIRPGGHPKKARRPKISFSIDTSGRREEAQASK